MFIYKITNKVNGKVYIGQTIRPIEQRFRRHINDSLNNVIDTHFSRAIRKYGEDKFDVECIDNAETQEELTNKEQYWIRKYNSANSDIGYNETDAIYKCGGNTYASKTESELNDIKQKIQNAQLGEKNNNAKAVKCLNIETNEEIVFQTVNECRIYFNEKHHRFITSRVAGNTISLYKNIWKIAYVNDEYKEFIKKTKKRIMSITITDITTQNSETYNSMNKLYEKYDFEWHEVKGRLYEGDGRCKDDTHYEFIVREIYKIEITILN